MKRFLPSIRSRRLAPLAFLLAAGQCLACYAPPERQLASVDEQLMLAADVSLATVTREIAMAGADTEYEFLVQKRLAGPDRKSFSMLGRSGSTNSATTTFDNHNDAVFWQRGGGRLFNDTSCVIHPTFVVGETYLVFMGQPVTRRSFERIDMKNGDFGAGDKWLNFVESRLGARK